MSEAQNLPAVREQPKHNIVAGNPIRALIPDDANGVVRLANICWLSGLAPRDLKNAEACAVAIFHGLEIGLPPMTALQKIAVINGRPTIWGDVALGLVRASGQMTDFEETQDDTGATCKVHRKGDKRPIIHHFTIEDAKKANLWNKEGPWRTYPKRMLQMRARAFCLRDAFPDVLGGLYIAEELQGEMKGVTPRGAVLEAPSPEEEESGNASKTKVEPGSTRGDQPSADASVAEVSTAEGAQNQPSLGRAESAMGEGQSREGEGAARSAEVNDATDNAARAAEGTAEDLPPLEDPSATAAEWISLFKQAPTPEDLKEVRESERVDDYLDAHAFTPEIAAAIERAYNHAMAAFPTPAEVEEAPVPD